MFASQLVGQVVIRDIPIIDGNLADTEYMCEPSLIVKYEDGWITLRNAATGEMSCCNNEWDDYHWVVADKNLIARNKAAIKSYGYTLVSDILKRVDQMSGMANPYTEGYDNSSDDDYTSYEPKKDVLDEILSDLAKKTPSRDQLRKMVDDLDEKLAKNLENINTPEDTGDLSERVSMVIRDEEIAPICMFLHNYCNDKEDGYIVIIDMMNGCERKRIGFECHGDASHGKRRFRITTAPRYDVSPDIILIDCNDFYYRIGLLIDYGVEKFISMLQLAVMMYSEYVGMHSLKCIDDGDAILCAGSSLFRAHVYQESEHVEICRDLGNPNGDVPSVVLSEDECERVAKLMNQKASKSISFEDL